MTVAVDLMLSLAIKAKGNLRNLINHFLIFIIALETLKKLNSDKSSSTKMLSENVETPPYSEQSPAPSLADLAQFAQEAKQATHSQTCQTSSSMTVTAVGQAQLDFLEAGQKILIERSLPEASLGNVLHQLTNLGREVQTLTQQMAQQNTQIQTMRLHQAKYHVGYLE